MSLTFGALTSDRVSCGTASSLDDLTTHTALSWIYPTTLTNGKAIISKFRGVANAGWQLTVNGALGEISWEWARATAYANFVSNTTPLATNAWRFVAATCDQAASPVAHIYTGTLGAIASEVGYGTAIDGSGTFGADGTYNLFIGNRDIATPTAAFQGRIAFSAVWNRVLTLGEIQAQQFRPHVTSGCVLFMHLGANGTGTQPDWSGNGNNGTVTGATVADHVPIRPWFGWSLPQSYAAGTTYTESLSLARNVSAAISNTLVASEGLTLGRSTDAGPGNTLGALESLNLARNANLNLSEVLAALESMTLGRNADITAMPVGNQFARPDSDIAANGWVPSTGSDLFDMVNELSYDDADDIYINNASGTCEIRLSDVTDPSSSSGHVIRYRAKRTLATPTLTVYLYQGATQIASHTPTLGTSYQTFTYTLSSGEADSITDYTDLRLHFAGAASGGVGRYARVSWAEIEFPPGVGGGTTYTESLSLARNVDVAIANILTALEALSLGRSADAGPGSILGALDTLTAGRSASIGLSTVLAALEAMTLGRNADIAAAPGVISESVTLARALSIGIVDFHRALNTMTLGRQVDIQGASSWITSVSLVVGRSVGITGTNTLTALSSLTMARSLGITAVPGAVLESLILGRSVGITPASTLKAREALTIGRSNSLIPASYWRGVVAVSLGRSASLSVSLGSILVSVLMGRSVGITPASRQDAKVALSFGLQLELLVYLLSSQHGAAPWGRYYEVNERADLIVDDPYRAHEVADAKRSLEVDE